MKWVESHVTSSSCFALEELILGMEGEELIQGWKGRSSSRGGRGGALFKWKGRSSFQGWRGRSSFQCTAHTRVCIKMGVVPLIGSVWSIPSSWVEWD